MTGRPCDVPSGGHDGPVRLYPGGRLCTAHAPQPRPRVERTTAPARAAATKARPIDPVGPILTGLLSINCGRPGSTAGTWVQAPRARYECWPCQYVSPDAVGEYTVLEFIATARAHHHQKHQRNQGAAA
ncbi:hypothetical protein ACFWTC_03025 [Streptomyces sp. NPDC058619]|uniref:hypothetical protein n=1 Tax=unclassified Streptomyces TaxID=2593676 RepID=UPI00365E6569